MISILPSSILIVALFAAPHPWAFKYSVTSADPSIRRDDIVAPFERGLFGDSVIVRGVRRGLRDTSVAARANRTQTLVVIADVEGDPSSLRVVLVVKNVLANPVVGPDTTRTTRAGLDSAMVAAGRRIAKKLATR
jgi:hypothetical protein